MMLEISVDVARERLLDQVFEARTLGEVSAARQALHEWLRLHPDEPGMADAFEVLSHRADPACEQEASVEAEHQANVGLEAISVLPQH
jgi:hypothetical protein